MRNNSFALVQSVLTGVLIFTSLLLLAILLSEAQPATTYVSTEDPVVQTRLPEEVFVPETKEEEPQVATTSKVPEAQESISAPPQQPAAQSEFEDTPVKAPSYDIPPLGLEIVNTVAQPALVNILCASRPGSNIRGATGSGVFIDSRGVILTNAHVAQYFLLEQHPSRPVSCVIRTGAPAQPRYSAEVLAFPLAWAQEYGSKLLEAKPTGTGEHDWALLYVTGRTDGSQKPVSFPAVPFDARNGITKTGDSVLLVSYPAGFLGGQTIRKDLWPTSTVVSIQKVYTFVASTIDLLALGGNIVAQPGSSGGAVLNAWGQLVGVIVTSSTGDSTAERDLRAVTLSHIDRSVQAQTGLNLSTLLQQGNFENRVATFAANSLPHLLPLFPL